MEKDKIFISYSHRDKAWLDEIHTSLKPFIRNTGVVVWNDRSIKAGDLWYTEIEKALQTASLAVLLVSRNFLASDFIMNVELPYLLNAAEAGHLKVCWILVEDCPVETTTLPRFQATHDLQHPLDTLKKAQRNKVLTDIARTISTLHKTFENPAPKPSSDLPLFHSINSLQIKEYTAKYITELLSEESMLLSAEKLIREKAEHFVGRIPELSSISRALDTSLKKERTETVSIKGDFGTGKTALISKVVLNLTQIQSRPILPIYTQCQKERQYDGWLAFISLFKSIIIKTIKNKSFTRKQIAQYLSNNCLAWLKLAEPEFGSVIGNPKFSQDVIHSQFLKFLKKVGSDQTLVLIIDDLQWADKSSLNLLSYLTQENVSSPLLILTAFRPEGLEFGPNAEELRKMRRKLLLVKNYTDIDLSPGINVEDYIQNRYQNNKFPTDLIRKIEHFSDGQALYLDQLFTLWEQKSYIYYDEEKNHWALVDATNAPSIPESIEEVLNERLNEMKDDYRDILRIASIEGEEFTVQVVSKLIKREEDDLILDLPKLGAESRFIVEEGPQDIDVMTFDFYKFTHRFFREYIYNRLGSEAQRRRFHREVADYLEGLELNKQPLAGMLAYHYSEAHEPSKRMIYTKLAAKQAYENGKWGEAIDWSKEMLKLVSEKKKQHLQDAVDVIVIWEKASENSGSLDGLSSIIDEYIQLVKENSVHKHLYAQLLEARAHHCYFGNKKHGTRHARLALQLFRELGDIQKELDAKRLLADLLIDYENNLTEGIKLNHELVAEAETYQDFNKIAYNYSSLAWSLIYAGRHDEALTIATKAYGLFNGEEGKDIYIYAFALRVLGRAFYKLGQYSQAAQYQESAIAIYQQIGNALEEHWVRFELGATYIDQSRSESGVLEYNACLNYSEKIYAHEFQAWVRAEFATLAILNGDYKKAESQLAKVEELLQDGTQEDRFDHLIRLGHLKLRQNNENEAKKLLTEARNIINSTGFEIEITRINNIYVEFYLASNETKLALNCLKENIELCSRLGAKLELGSSYEKLGNIHKLKKDYVLSKNSYQSALSLYKELKLLQRVSIVTTILDNLVI